MNVVGLFELPSIVARRAAAILLVLAIGGSTTYAATKYVKINADNSGLFGFFFQIEDAVKAEDYTLHTGYQSQIGDYLVSVLSSIYSEECRMNAFLLLFYSLFFNTSPKTTFFTFLTNN